MKTQTGKTIRMRAVLLAAAALALAGCGEQDKDEHPPGHEGHDMSMPMPMHEPASPAAGRTEAAGRLMPVAADRVCMVNDQVFSTPQIPVEVDGRVYYGCCEGCKATLANDRRARMAVDPLTGQEVDKATASIGAFPDGGVLYFASDAHRDAFDPARMN